MRSSSKSMLKIQVSHCFDFLAGLFVINFATWTPSGGTVSIGFHFQKLMSLTGPTSFAFIGPKTLPTGSAWFSLLSFPVSKSWKASVSTMFSTSGRLMFRRCFENSHFVRFWAPGSGVPVVDDQPLEPRRVATHRSIFRSPKKGLRFTPPQPRKT